MTFSELLFHTEPMTTLNPFPSLSIPGRVMVHYYFIEISHKFKWEWQLNTSSQPAKIGLQGKKKFVSKGAHNFSKKSYNHEN